MRAMDYSVLGHYGPAVEATDHASGEEERDLLCECVVCVRSRCTLLYCAFSFFVKGAKNIRPYVSSSSSSSFFINDV